jgi:hypothetical protein
VLKLVASQVVKSVEIRTRLFLKRRNASHILIGESQSSFCRSSSAFATRLESR